VAIFFTPPRNSSEVSLQEGQVVQTLASKAVSLHDFAEDDVIFCHGNRAVSWAVGENSWKQ